MSPYQLRKYRTKGIRIFIILGIVLQTMLPIIQRGPGWIRTVAAKEIETYDDKGVEKTLESAAYQEPYQFPEDAQSLRDLLPADLPQLAADTMSNARGNSITTVSVSAEGGFAQIGDNMLVIVDEKSIEQPFTIQVGEPGIFAGKSDSVAHEKKQLSPLAQVDSSQANTVKDTSRNTPSSPIASTDDAVSTDENEKPRPHPVGEPLDDHAVDNLAEIPPARAVASFNPGAPPKMPEVPIAKDAADSVDPDLVVESAPNLTPSSTVPDTIDKPSALENPTETIYDFSFTIVDTETGEPITDTNGLIHIAVDLRDAVAKKEYVWTTILHPANDNRMEISPGLTVWDSAGFLGFAVDDLMESAEWEVRIDTLGGNAARTLSNGSSSADLPKPWKPTLIGPTVSEFSGAATYQYAIPLPAGRGGLTPNIDLSYSSSALRGMFINKGQDQGSLGIGWSFPEISITRTENRVDNGGVIIHGDRFALVLNGQTHDLLPLPNPTATQRDFVPLNNPSMRVRMIHDPSINIDGLAYGTNGPEPGSIHIDGHDEIYWEVTTGDGTRYRLGYTLDSQDYHWNDTGNADREVLHRENEEHDHTTGWEGRFAHRSAFRWRVDTVTDVHGNQVQYDYYRYQVGYENNVRTLIGRPQEIRYNYAATADTITDNVARLANNAGDFATKVVFERRTLSNTNIGDSYRVIKNIKIYHLHATQPIRTINFNHALRAYDNNLPAGCDYNGDWSTPSVSIRLTKISSVDWFGAGEPPIVLFYRDRFHGTGDFDGCFRYSYLDGIRNELGGYTRIIYGSDNRGKLHLEGSILTIPIFDWFHWWLPGGFDADRSITKSYFVTRIQQFDGVTGWRKNPWDSNHGQYAETQYIYSNPCYDYGGSDGQSGLGSGMGNPSICKTLQSGLTNEFTYGMGKLAGFGNLQVKQFDYDGSQIGRTRTWFHDDGFDENAAHEGFEDLLVFGRPWLAKNYSPENVLLSKQESWYTTQQSEKPYFTPTTAECTTTYAQYTGNEADLIGEQVCTNTYYNEHRQGNAQYGNATLVQQSGNIGGVQRTISQYSYFYPRTDPNLWIVNKAAINIGYDTVNVVSERISRSWTYFDNNSATTPPTRGLPTKIQVENDGQYPIVQTMTYDTHSNLESSTDALQNTTWTFWDSTWHLYPVVVVNPLSHTEIFQYRNINAAFTDGPPGSLRNHWSADGIQTVFHYDGRGRLIKTFNGWHQQGSDVSRPSVAHLYFDGKDINNDGKIDYLPWVATWTKTQDDGVQWTESGTRQVEIMDGLGRIVQTQTAAEDWKYIGNINGTVTLDGHKFVTDVTYNAAGVPVKQSIPYRVPEDTDVTDQNLYFTPQTWQPNVETVADASGRVIEATDQLGNTGQTIYGNRSSWIVDPNLNVGISHIDDAGQLIAVDEALETWRDGFNTTGSNPIDASWTHSGSVVESGGTIRIDGAGGWNDYIANDVAAIGKDAGVGIRFQVSSVHFSGHLLLDKGDYNTNGFHRYGITIGSEGMVLDRRINNTTANGDGTKLMPFSPNRWYHLIMRPAQDTTGDWMLMVWDETDPEQRAEIRLPADGWPESTWRFVAMANVGMLTLEDYREYEFYRTSYEYDASGNLTQVINGLGNLAESSAERDQHTTTMTYDMLGRKTAMTDPDMGSWTYEYDDLGNLERQVDANGDAIRFEYDELSRLTAKLVDNATFDPKLATYGYDDTTTGGGQGAIGKRTSMESYRLIKDNWSILHNTAEWEYDSLGRVKTEVRDFPGDSTVSAQGVYAFDFTYTQGGLVTAIRYPDWETVTTDYHWVTGQPKSLSGHSTYVQNGTTNGATYNAAGQMTGLTFGQSGGTMQWTYNDAFQLTGINSSIQYAPDRTFEYDAIGNITEIEETIHAYNIQAQEFSYDSLHRLTRAKTSGHSAGSYDQTMQYDALGNIVSKDGLAYGYGAASGIAAGAKIHAVTHLDNALNYAYDANGNTTLRYDRETARTWAYAWTHENMLERATDTDGNEVEMVYDADGQLILRLESGGAKRTVTLADGLYQKEYLGSAYSIAKRYMFGGTPVAERDSSGNVFFLMLDHLGGTIATFGATGGLSKVRRDAWGKELHRDGSLGSSSYLYTAQRWDELLNLYDYNARYYDPNVGRFLSADSIVPLSEGGSIQPLTASFSETLLLLKQNAERTGQVKDVKVDVPKSSAPLNRYSYTVNNPVNYNDPNGHHHKPSATFDAAQFHYFISLLISHHGADIANQDFIEGIATSAVVDGTAMLVGGTAGAVKGGAAGAWGGPIGFIVGAMVGILAAQIFDTPAENIQKDIQKMEEELLLNISLTDDFRVFIKIDGEAVEVASVTISVWHREDGQFFVNIAVTTVDGETYNFPMSISRATYNMLREAMHITEENGSGVTSELEEKPKEEQDTTVSDEDQVAYPPGAI